MEVEFCRERRQSRQNEEGNVNRSRETDEDRKRLNIAEERKRIKERKEIRESKTEKDGRERGKGYIKSDRERKRSGGANDCRIAPSPTRFRLYRFRDSPCVLCRIVVG